MLEERLKILFMQKLRDRQAVKQKAQTPQKISKNVSLLNIFTLFLQKRLPYIFWLDSSIQKKCYNEAQ